MYKSFRFKLTILAAACVMSVSTFTTIARAQSAVPLQPARADAHAMHAMLLDATYAGSRVVVVGTSGYIVLSDDNGSTYRQAKKVPVDFTLTSVSFIDDRQGWACGHGGTILHTEDGGETWSVQRTDTSVDQPLFAIHFTDALHGWAAGLWSLLLHTTDGGKTWDQIKLPVAEGQKRADLNLLSIFTGGDKVLYLTAEQGTVYRSADDGQHWDVLPTGSKASMWRGVATADGAIVVGGLGGKLLRSVDGGVHWDVLVSPTTGSITGLRADGQKIVASSLSGALLVSEDGGQRWREMAAARLPLTALVLAGGRAERPLVYSKEGPAKLEPRSGR